MKKHATKKRKCPACKVNKSPTLFGAKYICLRCQKKQAKAQWEKLLSEASSSGKGSKPAKDPICPYCKKPKKAGTGSIYHPHCRAKRQTEISFSDYDGLGLM